MTKYQNSSVKCSSSSKMALMTLLNCNAVPFQFPEDDKSVAARRFRSRAIRREFEQNSDLSANMDQHLFMSTIMNEAEAAFNTVLAPRREALTPARTITGVSSCGA